jgi:holliday junction DNA helicase RuvA
MNVSNSREREILYEYITGTIQYISPQYIVVENNGIGYQIYTPNPYLFSQDSEKQKVYTYFHVRDDAHILYGFNSLEMKEFFIKLINVSGIGPKGALAILASGEPGTIAHAIEQENHKFLTTFPGVGKKTAQQIILDLKGKLQEFLTDFPDETIGQVVVQEENKELEEAMLALEALGYSSKEVNRIAPQLKTENLTTDQYLRLALQKLSNV